MKFKAFIRVVKSLNSGNYMGFDSVEIIREPLIEAVDKAGVKTFLLNKYPQFFQNGKVYEKETKDTAQFFYVVIFPLYNNEVDLINEGEWVCEHCKQVHENKYLSKPRFSKLFPDKLFCKNDGLEIDCIEYYKREYYKNVELADDEFYIKKDSPIYIYKITEKTTNKSYIGKTKNEPFFRWWNHLTKSSSPFGLYLRQTKLSDWVFEVIDILPYNTIETEVFRVESEYIVKFNSMANGFNSVISNKSVITNDESINQITLHFKTDAQT